MEEGQTPKNTYIAGDSISFTFEFEHEMNIDHVTVKFVNADATAQLEAEGRPELEGQSDFAKTSTVKVKGHIFSNSTPGRYELRTIIAHTDGERSISMSWVPSGISIWVAREPRTAPRFLRFLED